MRLVQRSTPERIRIRTQGESFLRTYLMVFFLVSFSIASILLSTPLVMDYTNHYLGTSHAYSKKIGLGGISSRKMFGELDDDEDDDNDLFFLSSVEEGLHESSGNRDDDDDDVDEEDYGQSTAVNREQVVHDDQDALSDQEKKDDDIDNENNSMNTDTNPTATDRKKMNVLVLYPDDWRHNSIGKENPIIQTPFLDSLADDGIRFRQNAVTTSICWTSRATLFSGQWASRHQSWKLKCPHFSKGRLWRNTWPYLLQEDGYFVGHVGKWQYHSDNRGRFDWSSFFEGKHWYPRHGKTVSGEDMAKDDAIRFLRERPQDKPFAMTVAFYPPKPVGNSDEPGGQWTPKNETKALYANLTIPEPYNASHAFHLLPDFLQYHGSAAVQRWRLRYPSELHYQEAMKNIYALITQVDDACKQIVDEIKSQGLYDNTMIIFTTDNGMFHGSHGLAGKWYPYQESIRVPLIIHDPRMPEDKVGTIDDSFTLNVDLAETILGAAGLKPHERMQGRDISDLYLPETGDDHKTALETTPWRDEFFYEFTYLEQHSFIPPSHALVRKDWKYINWYEMDHTQLFNLKEDPMEFTDVKDDPANEAILTEMRNKLAEYKEQLTEPEETHLECSGGDWSVNPRDEEDLEGSTTSS